MRYYILFSDRPVLTPETVNHGERVTFGPYVTREAAEADVDARRMAFKRENPRKYKSMSPVSIAIIGLEEE